MPLVQRDIYSIQNFEVKGSKPFLYAPPLSMKCEQVLQNGNQNTMVGVLTQMALIASYANDIFTDLINMATLTTNRITNLNTQFARIQEAAPKFETYMSSNKPEEILSNPRSEFILPQIAEQQLFTTDSTPKPVKELYQKALPPPPLHMMDPYMDEGRKCLELYTNPHYFLDEWIAEQYKMRANAKEERRKRREERRNKRDKNKDQGIKMEKKPTKIDKVVFDPLTGQKIVIKADSDSSTRDLRAPVQSTLKLSSSENPNTHNSHSPSQSQNVSNSAYFSSPPQLSRNSSVDEYPAPPPDDFPPPPPPSNEFVPHSSYEVPKMEVSAPPMPRDVYNPNSAQIQSPSTGNPPPPPPPSFTGFSVPPSTAYAPPPPPTNMPPPPPAPEVDMGANLSSNPLLAAIASKGLKSVSALPAAKKVDTHSDLLHAIKSGKSLKTTVKAPEAEKKNANGSAQPASVAEILSRRIAIAPSDEDSDDDSDENQWD